MRRGSSLGKLELPDFGPSNESPSSGRKMDGLDVVGKGGTSSKECELAEAEIKLRLVESRLSPERDERRSCRSRVAVESAETIVSL